MWVVKTHVLEPSSPALDGIFQLDAGSEAEEVRKQKSLPSWQLNLLCPDTAHTKLLFKCGFMDTALLSVAPQTALRAAWAALMPAEVTKCYHLLSL